MDDVFRVDHNAFHDRFSFWERLFRCEKGITDKVNVCIGLS